MISTSSRAFASSARTVDSPTSRASCAPAGVVGPLGPLDASVPEGRKCDGFVLVTSWNPDDVSARRPEPWQLGQVVVLRPRAVPMRPSPPHKRQTSPSMGVTSKEPSWETCSTDPRRAATNHPRRRVRHLQHDVAFGRRRPCGGFRRDLYCTNGGGG